MFGLLWSALIGLIAGALAKLVMKGKDPGGFWVSMGLGVVGAIVTKYLGQMLGLWDETHNTGLIGSFVGAVLLLWIYRMIQSRKAAA
jgi:uncharacterized membrane protein YeaQ/YmgE (transglycosylase-associated protein family)